LQNLNHRNMTMSAENGSAPTRAVGQPTKYRQEYCDSVKTFMGQGYSLTAFAGSIRVSRETVYEWERVIPEFSDAVKSARAMRVMCLEGGLLSGDAASPQITARIFALKNACPPEWRDKHEFEHTGKDGGPIQHSAARDRLADLISKGDAEGEAAADNPGADGA
jgi:hypothetical protein